VHIERSLRIGDRLDGHFVQGHVDGTATLIKRTADKKETRLHLETTPELAIYLSPKGSVTLDGVSLTLASVDGPRFEVALIPTTLERTTLGTRDIGWPFNVEADILSKTVVNYLRQQGR
jgi:riboflavin synthase